MDSLPPTHPSVAVCPSAGIGHLTPFLRLASMLATSPNTCTVTLIIIRPTLSSAEANQINTFLATHPHINLSEFHTPQQLPHPTIHDPFFRQYNAVSRSAHHLVDHLSTLSPQPSAVFSDLMLASGINKALAHLGVANYTVITTSARFFSLMVTLPTNDNKNVTVGDDIEIPGLGKILGDDVPPPFYNPNNAFTQLVDTNCRHLHDAKGIIINSFDLFEPESISALKTGKVLSSLPLIFPVGPLLPFGSTKGSSTISWLDNQPSKSTIFVSFGSRTAMTKDQIKELGKGIESSGMSFLWVIKTTIVDKEEKEELSNLLGESFLERTKERGLIVKEWVNQEEILAHPATGGFITHCGWNSIMEAAQRGVPLLAWPLHGDQRVNAGVVEKAGLGIWERSWGWGGEKLVKGEEIAEKIEKMMTSEKLRCSAEKVGVEARKAWENDGSSRTLFNTIINMTRKEMDKKT